MIAYKKRIEDSFDNIEDYAESNLQDDKIKKEKVTRDFDLNEKADCGFDLNKFSEEKDFVSNSPVINTSNLGHNHAEHAAHAESHDVTCEEVVSNQRRPRRNNARPTYLRDFV